MIWICHILYILFLIYELIGLIVKIVEQVFVYFAICLLFHIVYQFNRIMGESCPIVRVSYRIIRVILSYRALILYYSLSCEK